MTVAELIERLKTFPPDMRVMTPGFDESGYDYVKDIDQLEVVQVNDGKQTGGQFEKTGSLHHSDRADGAPLSVIVINF
jgi:hypothetical protein